MRRSGSSAVTERLVINTGPLIALERMGVLDLLERLPFAFISPQEVRAELDAGARMGFPQISPAGVRFQRLERAVPVLALAGLDSGEAAVIQLALEEGISTVVIDEWKGRRAARAVDLRVTGSLGLLGRAKVLGLLSAVRPLVERASAAGVRCIGSPGGRVPNHSSASRTTRAGRRWSGSARWSWRATTSSRLNGLVT